MAENEKVFPIKIKLKKPILDQNEKEITEIVIDREPTAGDFADFNFAEQTTGGYLAALARLVGIPVPHLKKLSFADTKTIIGELNSFL